MKNRIQQQSFGKLRSHNKLIHGGEHRKKRWGRTARPLSSKNAHHIVFKVNREKLINKSFRHPKNFKHVQQLLQRYASMFFIKVEQISYQHDHIHILARSGRRANFHHFFRVFSGQVAQSMKMTVAQSMKVTDTPSAKEVGLWKSRPFTRIVVGVVGLRVIKNYIQLNEKEVTGLIAYQKKRLRGLSMQDWKLLWKI